MQVNTSKSPEKLTSLDDYISRMKPDQKDILYIAGVRCTVLQCEERNQKHHQMQLPACNSMFCLPRLHMPLIPPGKRTRHLHLMCSCRCTAGRSRDEVENSPFLEKLKRKDYEVIYFTDALDECVTFLLLPTFVPACGLCEYVLGAV
jgi:Hsp90 protein